MYTYTSQLLDINSNMNLSYENRYHNDISSFPFHACKNTHFKLDREHITSF